MSCLESEKRNAVVRAPVGEFAATAQYSGPRFQDSGLSFELS